MNLGMEPSQWAELLATKNIATLKTRLQNQQNALKTEQAAVTALKTALTNFRTTLTSFGTGNSSLVQNSATANRDGYVTLKANSSASTGLYHLTVVATAQAKQEAFEGLTNEDLANASGTLTLSVGGKSLDIDLSAVNSLAELRDAINRNSDNPGATASLIRKDGELVLLLASNKTGEDNAYTLDHSNSGLAADKFSATTISDASNARVKLGEMDFESNTNNFDQLIPGVDLTVVQPTEENKPLVITVGNDLSATREQAQRFITGYNQLRSELDRLTQSGGANGGRGALAGDSAIQALKQELNSLLREGNNGAFLSDFGISADKDGQLKLDSEKFEEAMKQNPARLDALFGGNDGLLKKMEKSLDGYLSTSTGAIKQRQETLDRKNELMSRKEEQMKLSYDSAYQRYLNQFTRLQASMAQLESTMGQFS